MSPTVKTAQMGESSVSRNFLQGIFRAVVCVAVLWAVMHFFFVWQDGGLASNADTGAKVMPTVTSSR